MRRLMELFRHGRLDLTPFLIHMLSLGNITEAYKVFGKAAGVKVAIKP
jgi:threonine dehydrogenase-like Zn-dependent dehydrogenase